MSYLDRLQRAHRDLDAQIDKLANRPAAQIAKLKKQRLAIRDQIARQELRPLTD